MDTKVTAFYFVFAFVTMVFAVGAMFLRPFTADCHADQFYFTEESFNIDSIGYVDYTDLNVIGKVRNDCKLGSKYYVVKYGKEYSITKTDFFPYMDELNKNCRGCVLYYMDGRLPGLYRYPGKEGICRLSDTRCLMEFSKEIGKFTE